MLFSFLFFVKSQDEEGVLAQHYSDKSIIVTASGSSKQIINGTKQMTLPEYAVYPNNKRWDWCSMCERSYDSHPWITFSLKIRKIKFNSYFLRCGCCYSDCCCESQDYSYCFYCCLYSWSLQISDDNQTWTEVHRIDKDTTMRRCNEKTYQLDKEYTAKYIRFIQNQPCPGDPPCISINKIEFFGSSINEGGVFEEFGFNDDEDVSIIGHISKSGNIRN